MSMPKHIFRLFITSFTGLMLFFSAHAETTNVKVQQTKTKLKQLDAQINRLQEALTSAHDKQGLLNKELAQTEKQIGEGIRQLHQTQNEMLSKERKIAVLHDKDSQLHQELKNQQELLAGHVRARYRIGEYQPLKWVLNQDDPNRISRLLTYYQYLVKSRQNLIDNIDETRKKINENKVILNSELAKTQQLRDELTQHQQELTKAKTYHTQVIQSLDKEIQNNQVTLSDVKKDKENLSNLLKSLSQQSVIQISKPFLQMRKKLPLPIQTAHRSLKKMNQGVTFFADEGTVVTAVYPGKVVFSDWLKGYGLLLIIDHGQGFMTLYAHNQSLFKSKGQMVHQNEQVASVGHSGGIKQNGLYFEIRQKGKAVPPLTWLS
ncbi:MAG: peptidase M24 [Legionella sp.]|nr:MAG: peptidase M24 [Legionella sp.]